ncbi:MAG: type II secretion system protein [Patescibacteria group bacterium]
MKRILAQLGFTMIELLVVIAVIGVLAVAVLSSINPIEQINKGRDTGHRSDAAQLINAIDRYYAIHEIYPWNDATYNTLLTVNQPAITVFPGGTPASCAVTANTGSVPGEFCKMTNAAAVPWLTALTDTAEVKEGFTQRLTAPKIGGELWLYKAATTNATMYACFAPASKAFQKEALDACRDHYTALPTGACPAGSSGYSPLPLYTTEFICLP